MTGGLESAAVSKEKSNAATLSRGDQPMLTIAIPCYNEENILEANYKRLKDTCESQGMPYEIIFGNDGSVDRTLEMIEGYAASDSNVRVTSHFPNRGAGYTYREMWRAARGEIIIQMDADLAMPAEVTVPTLLAALNDGADIAVGSRYVGIKAEYPLKRVIFSRGYTMITRLLFNLDVVDTQTGFIGFYKRILPELDPRSDGFEILVEFIAQANEVGFRIAEVGIPWFHDTTSGETEVWSESVKMLTGTLKVKRRFGQFKRERSKIGR
jgi:dolichol-phosphate mannosyltransferase